MVIPYSKPVSFSGYARAINFAKSFSQISVSAMKIQNCCWFILNFLTCTCVLNTKKYQKYLSVGIE